MKNIIHFSSRNIESIKSEAVWSDETQRWKLPELIVVKTKLPPASLNGNNNERCDNNSSSSSLINGRVPSKTAPPSLISFDTGYDDDHENHHSVLLKVWFCISWERFLKKLSKL